MTRSEKYLYHQIHPIKLLVDYATSFASTWLLWERHWALAAFIAFAPSILASAFLVTFVDLQRYKETLLGHYIAKHMTRKIEAMRLLGQFLMWAGAALHSPWLIPFGFVVIVFAWLSGLLSPVRSDGPHAS